MASTDKVTVDKAYFDALLRRANFHTSAQIYRRPDSAKVSISPAEYDGLLCASREYESLKAALFQGGITPQTLQLLISGAGTTEQRKDSGAGPETWVHDLDQPYATGQYQTPQGTHAGISHNDSWRQSNLPSFNLAPGSGPYMKTTGHDALQPRATFGVSSYGRQVSFGAPPSSVLDDAVFDDNTSLPGNQLQNNSALVASGQEQRTLYFAGLSERTTLREVISVVKGGKLLSINIGPNRSGTVYNSTVTFMEGHVAAGFLAWAKRNDVYIDNKRIEIRWADRQYRLNDHISNKTINGATRNILIRNASANGLTGSQIKDDMEHIHNLIIVDITFRDGDAYVSTNSVHNALFARTCMMSRTTYKGCKIEFYRDECDAPLPVPPYKPREQQRAEPSKKRGSLANRFDMLAVDGSDEENCEPVDFESEGDETADLTGNSGVSLHFLDAESTA
ncbi:hypothetical protein LTR62_004075 [Meristemomyces frigidus]|uniref:RRM domain-containing protein n=1 Tax=Meristemomyces frigidus TaxID=1508187 RepID=A0AAN7TRB7_9PEZI|nr:hypothetical protein LTR62_004075 [Meristemomyces frigidus]